MMFREIARLIETESGWTAGAQLQVGHVLQNAPVRMTLIQESGGKPEFTPNQDMVEVNIQALTRGATYFEAHDDAWALYQALHGLSNMNCPRIDGSGEDYLASTIEAIYAPQYIGEDVDRRHVFSTNYIFRMEEGACSAI